MSRLCHWGLLAICLTGLGTPATVQAGCCDSPSYYTGYTPYYTGYAGYGGYSGYYGAPYATGYYPGVGCTSCCQPCGCSPCVGNCGVGCASGNCSVGCSTTANSPGGLTPTPDPINNSSNIESRLQALEKALSITPPRPNRTYEDRFNSRGSGATPIPGRNSGGASDDPDNFPAPTRGNNKKNDEAEPFEENDKNTSRDALRPDLGVPGDNQKNETVIPSKKPAPGTGVDDKNKTDDKTNQTLRLDSRVTSRAVSPRERIGAAGMTTVVAAKKSNKTLLRVDAPTSHLARN